MLRGDPISGVASTSSRLRSTTTATAVDSQANGQAIRQTSPFPTSSFSFSFPGYEGFFDIAGNATIQPTDFDGSSVHDKSGISSGRPYSPIDSPPSAAETYSGLHAGNTSLDGFTGVAGSLGGIDESGMPMQFLGMMYPQTYDASGYPQQQYTHVDPTQLLGMDHEARFSTSFHPSPSSDGWANGFNSSTTASPEPYVTSSSSTPPMDGGGRATTDRKLNAVKRSTQDTSSGDSSSTVKKKGAGNSSVPSNQSLLRSSSTTPDSSTATPGANGTTGNFSEDGDQVPTVCTNCRTTNTPLWRRDPEGQPLCKFSLCYSVMFQCGVSH